ncbi:MAG: hypothetical protein WCD21_02370, partial [Streptomyces sp.]
PTPTLPPRTTIADRLRERPPPHTNYAGTSRITRVQDSGSRPLAFPDPVAAEHIKAAVLIGSLIAVGLAALLIRRRNGVYRRLYDEETRDDDHDGIPDIYQRADATER